jgi:hypothetical protein
LFFSNPDFGFGKMVGNLGFELTQVSFPSGYQHKSNPPHNTLIKQLIEKFKPYFLNALVDK